MAKPTIHDVARLADEVVQVAAAVVDDCAAVAGVVTVPWAMLSAGMPFPAFLEAVTTSCEHGGASGFIAGRVYWQEAVAMTGAARKEFLATVSRPRLEQSVAAMSGRARPWDRASQPSR